MNEYYRMGKGDEYIEVSINWEKDSYTKLIWWLQEIVGGSPYTNKKLKEALLEVANNIGEK